jgi:hypothetical protein
MRNLSSFGDAVPFEDSNPMFFERGEEGMDEA